MSNVFDIGIIGGGVAGCFAATRIAEKYPNNKVVLTDFGAKFSKRRRFLEGALGCFPNSDGKLYLNNLSQVSEIADGRKVNAAYKWVMETLSEVNPMKVIKDTMPSAAAQKRIKEAGFDITLNDHIQWKPESIHLLSRLISEKIEKAGNVQFSFDNEVFKILKKKNVFVISTATGDIFCKKIILCVGRSGWRWVNKLYKDLGLVVNDDYAYYGARIEISSQYLKDFNKSHCTLNKEGLECGPFSHSGTVIPEDHADLVTSAFRSNEDRWKSDKVSFSVLTSKYCPDNGCLQTERLGKLAFLLANDRVGKERIRSFMRKENELTLIPEYQCLFDIFTKLNLLIPNLLTKGYYYTPNVLTLTSKIRLGTNLESEIDGLYVAGESAGVVGLLSAALMGTVAADNICK